MMFCANPKCNNVREPNFSYCKECLEKIKKARPEKKDTIEKRLKENE